ncbi:hypothetical protein EJB05_07178, partial [Eragrostis curvula]
MRICPIASSSLRKARCRNKAQMWNGGNIYLSVVSKLHVVLFHKSRCSLRLDEAADEKSAKQSYGS